MTPKQIRDLATSLGLSASDVSRYAKTSSPIGWVRRNLDFLFGKSRTTSAAGGGASQREVMDFLGKISEPEAPPIITTRSQTAGRSSPPSPPTAPPGGRGRGPGPTGPGPTPAPSSPNSDTGSKFSTLRAPPRPGEASSYGQEILTPQSSNVFAFSYDGNSSTLFVTYKAPTISGEHTSRGRVKRGRGAGRDQMVGRSGAIKGKSNSRGSQYAYFDVPARVYDRMKLAASKGKFVWDELRVRGSIYGHRYRYALAQGAVITQDNVSGVYVPRKATAKGFRTRSMADFGQGRRGFQTSTLPQQNGFSTRRKR